MKRSGNINEEIYEISYLPSLILNNTPITRLDKEYVSRSSTTSDTGQLNDVFWNEAWSKRKSIILTIFIFLEFDKRS